MNLIPKVTTFLLALISMGLTSTNAMEREDYLNGTHQRNSYAGWDYLTEPGKETTSFFEYLLDETSDELEQQSIITFYDQSSARRYGLEKKKHSQETLEKEITPFFADLCKLNPDSTLSINSLFTNLEKDRVIEQYTKDKKLLLFIRVLRIIPESIGDLVNLEILELSHNTLSILPDAFTTLVNLTRLDLSKNNLQILPCNFGKLNKLKDLKLNNNQLSALPHSFFELKNLKQLSLNNNNLSALPSSFFELKNLEELTLNNNQLRDLYFAVPVSQKWMNRNETREVLNHLRDKRRIILNYCFLSFYCIDNGIPNDIFDIIGRLFLLHAKESYGPILPRSKTTIT